MDISRVCQDENLRQELIEKQKGDGTYNPHTGVYKWGSNIYDLTKTNGEPGLGWLPIRGKVLEYKTIHENKQDLNKFIETKITTVLGQFPEAVDFKLPVSGVIGEGLSDQQPTLIEVLNNLENYILSLPKIKYVSDGTGHGYIEEGLNESGIYIKLEDVLKLFGAEK